MTIEPSGEGEAPGSECMGGCYTIDLRLLRITGDCRTEPGGDGAISGVRIEEELPERTNFVW
jgi:hypothetical protein